MKIIKKYCFDILALFLTINGMLQSKGIYFFMFLILFIAVLLVESIKIYKYLSNK